ncbi:transposase family protein [Streptomyces sp. NBC_01707]|uniref:transposase family protein n=1 Tax=Streptomyces sp. NBC_01707 TaxID=2975914 RepID=UPI00352E0A8C
MVLTLAACAVLAGATSLLAVGEWIADAPPHVLAHVGARLDPLPPKRSLPAETTVRDCWAGSTTTHWTLPSASGLPTPATLSKVGRAAWPSTGTAM